MKNIVPILMHLVLLFSASAAYAQADEKEKESRKVTIVDDKLFTLQFTGNTSAQNVWIKVVYNSDPGTYQISMYHDSISAKNALDTFVTKDPLNYNELKDKGNEIAQKYLRVKNALSDASVLEVYRWIFYVRHTYDLAPLAGTLVLSEQAMVISSPDVKSQYKEFNKRMPFVKERTNRYSAIRGSIKLWDTKLNRRKMFIDSVRKTLDVRNVQGKKALTDLEEKLKTVVKALKDTKKSDSSAYNSVISKLQEFDKADKASSLNTQQTTNYLDVVKDSIAIIKLKGQKLDEERIALVNMIKNLTDTTKALINAERFFNINDEHSDEWQNLNTELPEFTQLIDTTKSDFKILSGIGLIRAINEFNKFYKQRKDSIAVADEQVDKLKNSNIFLINKISVQFERGFLERVQVWITVDDVEEIFENNYAIGFSSISNYKSFKNIMLYARSSNAEYPYIYLSDVFTYDNLLDNYTRDYCPADTAIKPINPADGKLVALNRERLINLIDAKLYTDLAGLSEKAPNGLVQVDVRKRFNLRTVRQPIYVRDNWGHMTYLNLWGTLSKIEKSKLLLPLRNDFKVVNNTLVSPDFATNLDLRQYEMASFGAEMNALLFDFPDNKVTLYLDLGARYGLTKVADSLLKILNNTASFEKVSPNILDAHTGTVYPKVSMEVFAQKRIGFTMSYQFNHTWLFSNNEFRQVMSYKKSPTSQTELEPPARNSHMFELFVRTETGESDNTKFFLRARLFMQQGDVNTFFSQIQLGMAYNVFYKK